MASRSPIEPCKRCRQPTVSGQNADGLCKPCAEKDRTAKVNKLHRRMIELLRARKIEIDWTGYEDVKRAIYEEPEPRMAQADSTGRESETRA